MRPQVPPCVRGSSRRYLVQNAVEESLLSHGGAREWRERRGRGGRKRERGARREGREEEGSSEWPRSETSPASGNREQS
eukprot:2660862-Heterocapsa_arctica.AAC.1